MSDFKVRDKVVVTKGRLKGETGTVIGFSDLNMEHVVIVRRDNQRARNNSLGFSANELRIEKETK